LTTIDICKVTAKGFLNTTIFKKKKKYKSYIINEFGIGSIIIIKGIGDFFAKTQ